MQGRVLTLHLLLWTGAFDHPTSIQTNLEACVRLASPTISGICRKLSSNYEIIKHDSVSVCISNHAGGRVYGFACLHRCNIPSIYLLHFRLIHFSPRYARISKFLFMRHHKIIYGAVKSPEEMIFLALGARIAECVE